MDGEFWDELAGVPFNGYEDVQDLFCRVLCQGELLGRSYVGHLQLSSYVPRGSVKKESPTVNETPVPVKKERRSVKPAKPVMPKLPPLPASLRPPPLWKGFKWPAPPLP